METQPMYRLHGQGMSRPTLGLISTCGARGLAAKIDGHLKELAGTGHGAPETFIVGSECPRFASGDAKGIIRESIRGSDIYFLVDVGNYSCTYSLFGSENRMSPDDHFQDLKRLIQATSGKAHCMSVIMPLLYGSRQHRRNYRESLDCAVALQELTSMGVSNIVTFDAHDARVQNAIPIKGFENIMPYYQVIKALLKNFPDIRLDAESFMVVSPDEGGMHRNMYFSSVLGVGLGMYYKRRDYARVVNGRNPIIAHEFLGDSVRGKTIFIADDVLASGESSLDIAYDLKKKRGAARIFVYCTYALFTGGLSAYDEAVRAGVLDGLFSTNLTYRTEELLSRDWYYEVDCSKYVALVIASLNNEMSVGAHLNPHQKIRALLASRDAEKSKASAAGGATGEEGTRGSAGEPSAYDGAGFVGVTGFSSASSPAEAFGAAGRPAVVPDVAYAKLA